VDGYYDEWEKAKTTEERLAIITVELGKLEEKISVDFAFLKDLGYGTPEFVRRNDDRDGADCELGDYDNAPHIEGIYKNGKSRQVSVSGQLAYGLQSVQAKITMLAEDGSGKDHFTYEAYRRHAKRRDPGIEYYELHRNKVETLTDFYFRAVKEDFLSSLKEVVLGNEWLDIEPKDFTIMVGPPLEGEAAEAEEARKALEKLRAQPPVAVMVSAKPLIFAVAHKDTGLKLWNPASGEHTLDPLENFNRGKIGLYCYGKYICAVENYGLAGIVIDTENGRKLSLSREDYHSENCQFPIAFIENKGEILLVHGTKWNRIDFTRLRDFTLLTPREETDTKENGIDSQAALAADTINSMQNKPEGIDYFLSSLFVSPEHKQFASNGWVWQPMDRIQVYDVEEFFSQYDKASCVLDVFENQTGYNWDRPACFMAEGILAVAHNPNEGGNIKTPSVIELYDTTKKTEKPYRYEYEGVNGKTVSEGVYVFYNRIKTIPFDGVDKTREEDQDPSFTPVCNEVYGDLYYDKKLDVFIGIGEQQGLYISDSEGKVLLTDLKYADYQYSPAFRMFYRFSTAGGYKADLVSLDTILVDK
jgi:hypothetical protein